MASLSFALLCIFFSAHAQATAEIKIPEPKLSIFFERNSVEIDDSISVILQISNNSAQDISGLQLEMDAPQFMKLKTSGSDENIVSLGDIPAYSALKNNQLLLAVLPQGKVGDFNLVFTLSYHWQQEKIKHQAQVTLEKMLKVGLFGTDNVIGVPLAFAQFIVPGLFFLFVLRILRVLRGNDLEANEKIIIGVLVSAICLFIVNAIGRNVKWEWIRLFDLGSTISVKKLFFLAVSGIVMGLIAFLLWYCRRSFIRYQQRKFAFTGSEKNGELIYKALHLNGSYKGEACQFTCKDGTVYKASHYFGYGDSYVLLCSFNVDKEKLSDAEKGRIANHSKGGSIIQSAKHILAVIDILGKGTEKIQGYNLIKKTIGGNESTVASYYLTIKKDDVNARAVIGEQDMQLLELA